MRYGRTVPRGFLPVYSVPTEADAKKLLAMACGKNLEGEYIARELAEEQTLPNLYAFGDRLHEVWTRMQKTRTTISPSP